MPSFKDVDVLIIGGGIFGCMAAIELASIGLNIKLIETKSSLVAAASQNNQNRLHLGYIIRDLNTAIQCKSGFDEFKKNSRKAYWKTF